MKHAAADAGVAKEKWMKGFAGAPSATLMSVCEVYGLGLACALRHSRIVMPKRNLKSVFR